MAANGTLTATTILNSWKVEKNETLHRTVTMQVVGKGMLEKKKTSSLKYFYLSNGETVYRLTVWKNQMDVAERSLKLNHVVRIVKLRVVPFYRETDIEAYPSQLNTVNQFIALEESKYFTVKKQAFEEYPAVNAFPPFWKDIKSLHVRDSQLAMRALILNKPENVDTEKWISQSSCETNCLCFDIGDKSRYKVKCFVAYDSNDEEEMHFAQILGADMEILFAGASAQKIDDAISMFLPQLFYMAESSTKTLERAQEYASLVLDEKNVSPIKKKRRSFFD
ncbi:hypothetical protein DdX_11000 [Ditylenchus destructor]|uniref:Uncharacterized protein n=1 Tax=Ditylenchus destructor TaxID=166010 RepID=A0AAD4R1N6_9BILA|nr:hypothetical protein DdX_11000 [Ditylenchus destructor]